MTRAELKEQAKAQLKGNVWKLFGITVVYMLISMVVSWVASLVGGDGALTGIISLLGSIFVIYPAAMGLTKVFLNVTYGDEPSAATLMDGFKVNYINNVLLYVLIGVFTALWSILLVIPGIIAAYSYTMAPYILLEHPELSAKEAISLSKQMMKGHKFELFVLQLSFILWALLGVVTLGIAYIYVGPYITLTTTDFYHNIKGSTFPESSDSTSSYTEAASDVIEQTATAVEGQDFEVTE